MDMTEADVDLLPWSKNGTVVDMPAMRRENDVKAAVQARQVDSKIGICNAEGRENTHKADGTNLAVCGRCSAGEYCTRE
jgi:hypothetical protein